MNASTLVWVVVLLLALAGGLLAFSIQVRRGGIPRRDAPANAGEDALVETPDEPGEAAIPVEFRLATAAGDAPALTATPLDAASFQLAASQARVLNTRSGGVGRLAPVLKLVQLAAETAEPSGTRYLQVLVDGARARQADGKSLSALLLDRDGQIIDHARLKDVGRLRFGFGGALLFQAVSVIVAQKHLKEIDAQLGRIASGVDQIRAFLDRERRHEVLAIIDAMAQRIPEMEAGIVDERWQQQVGANDQSLARIQGHLREEIEAAVAGLGGFNASFWGAAKKRQDHIESGTQRFVRALSEWQLTTEARILGWNLLVAGPASPQLKAERRRSIEREIALLFADDGLAGRFDLGVREQVAKIQARVFKADAGRRRALLAGQQDDRHSQLHRQHAELLRGMDAVMAIEQGREGVLRLALKLEGEDVVEAYELRAPVEAVRDAGAQAPAPAPSIDAATPDAGPTLERSMEEPPVSAPDVEEAQSMPAAEESAHETEPVPAADDTPDPAEDQPVDAVPTEVPK